MSVMMMTMMMMMVVVKKKMMVQRRETAVMSSLMSMMMTAIAVAISCPSDVLFAMQKRGSAKLQKKLNKLRQQEAVRHMADMMGRAVERVTELEHRQQQQEQEQEKRRDVQPEEPLDHQPQEMEGKDQPQEMEIPREDVEMEEAGVQPEGGAEEESQPRETGQDELQTEVVEEEIGKDVPPASSDADADEDSSAAVAAVAEEERHAVEVQEELRTLQAEVGAAAAALKSLTAMGQQRVSTSRRKAFKEHTRQLQEEDPGGDKMIKDPDSSYPGPEALLKTAEQTAEVAEAARAATAHVSLRQRFSPGPTGAPKSLRQVFARGGQERGGASAVMRDAAIREDLKDQIAGLQSGIADAARAVTGEAEEAGLGYLQEIEGLNAAIEVMEKGTGASGKPGAVSGSLQREDSLPLDALTDLKNQAKAAAAVARHLGRAASSAAALQTGIWLDPQIDEAAASSCSTS